MSRDDWLVGGDRSSAAAERIYEAAADLIARVGYESFTIDALALEVHCSTATVYRHAGGKAAIRDAVVTRQASRILQTVREAIDGLGGSDRVVTATVVALQRLQSDPLVGIMKPSSLALGTEWLTSSKVISSFASEMLGDRGGDPLAAQWLIRVFLALWCWPVKDGTAQREMVTRFLGPAFAAG